MSSMMDSIMMGAFVARATGKGLSAAAKGTYKAGRVFYNVYKKHAAKANEESAGEYQIEDIYTLHCPHCNEEVLGGAKFCIKCGEKL